MTLFSDFSNNHFCIVAAHWSRLCSRWFIDDTVDDNIFHKTWLAFCWLTSTTWLLKFLQLFISLIWIMSQKRQWFFFLRSTALLVGHKKWIRLGSTLVKTLKCANHKKFRHTTKRLFLRQIRFFEQCNLAEHMLDLSDAIIDSTIPYYVSTLGKFDLCSQNNIVYYVWRHKTPWLTVSQNSMIKREINRCLNGLTTSLTDVCLLKMDYLHWWLH